MTKKLSKELLSTEELALWVTYVVKGTVEKESDRAILAELSKRTIDLGTATAIADKMMELKTKEYLAMVGKLIEQITATQLALTDADLLTNEDLTNAMEKYNTILGAVQEENNHE
jgi:hypothetical protein